MRGLCRVRDYTGNSVNQHCTIKRLQLMVFLFLIHIFEKKRDNK